MVVAVSFGVFALQSVKGIGYLQGSALDIAIHTSLHCLSIGLFISVTKGSPLFCRCCWAAAPADCVADAFLLLPVSVICLSVCFVVFVPLCLMIVLLRPLRLLLSQYASFLLVFFFKKKKKCRDFTTKMCFESSLHTNLSATASFALFLVAHFCESCCLVDHARLVWLGISRERAHHTNASLAKMITSQHGSQAATFCGQATHRNGGKSDRRRELVRSSLTQKCRRRCGRPTWMARDRSTLRESLRWSNRS